MRIGFNARVLADPAVRGLARYTVNLLRALSQRGDVELVLFSKEPLQPAHLAGISARVVVFDAPRESVWNDWELPRRIRREAIQVFHAPADRGLPLLKPCPMVVTVHGSFERRHWRDLFPGSKAKLWFWTGELSKYRADAVLTVSDTTRRDLVNLKVAPEAKIHRVYLAPAPEFSHNACPGDQSVLAQHGIDSPYLLYVGGYNSWKNVNQLVRAFSDANLPNHLLVIVAQKKWEYQTLIENWKSLACFPRLRLIEAPAGQIPSLYRHADVFVNPSIWESFSFQLVEAMACGTPILASDRTAIPEICGQAALFFDPDNTAALTRLMEQLVREPSLRQELRTRGFERVKEFSWSSTAEQTVGIYRQLSQVG